MSKTIRGNEEEQFQEFSKVAFEVMNETGLKPTDYKDMTDYVNAVDSKLNEIK